MGFTEQNLFNPQLSSLKGSNLAPESVCLLRAAKTIVLQGCDVENAFEHTSVMAAKELSWTSATYYAAGNFNMTNCVNKTVTPGISMHYFARDETLWQKWFRFARIHRKDSSHSSPKRETTMISFV